MIRFFVLLLGAMSFTTCSVSPEDTPGLCTLSCESAKIVGSDPSFKIIKNSNDMQFTCSANQANRSSKPNLSLLYYREIDRASKCRWNSRDGPV